MIGEVNDDHVAKDVTDAKALGLDAFAMNIGIATSPGYCFFN
jgi:hypothetical protein